MGERVGPVPELLPISGISCDNLADMMPVYDNLSARLKPNDAGLYRVFLATRILGCLYDVEPEQQAGMLVIGLHNIVSPKPSKKDNLLKVSKLFSDLEPQAVSYAVKSFKKPAQEDAVLIHHCRLLLGIDISDWVDNITDKSEQAIVGIEKKKQQMVLKWVATKPGGLRYVSMGRLAKWMDELDAQVRFAALMLDVASAPLDIRNEKAKELNMSLRQVRNQLVKIGLSEDEADLAMVSGEANGERLSLADSRRMRLESLPKAVAATEEAIKEQMEKMIANDVAGKLSASYDGTTGQFDEQIERIIADIERLKKHWIETNNIDRNDSDSRRIRKEITKLLKSEPLPDFSSMQRIIQATNETNLIGSSYCKTHIGLMMQNGEAMKLLGLDFVQTNQHLPHLRQLFMQYIDAAEIPYFTKEEEIVFVRRHMEKFKELMDRAALEA